MSTSLRLIFPLAAILLVAGLIVSPLADLLTLRWFTRDLDVRSSLISNTLQEPVSRLVKNGESESLQRFLERATEDERLFAVGFCDVKHRMVHQTSTFPPRLDCSGGSEILNMSESTYHVSRHTVGLDDEALGQLILVHDMGFIDQRRGDMRFYVFVLFIALAVFVSWINFVLFRKSRRSWMEGVQSLIQGAPLRGTVRDLKQADLRPLLKNLRTLIRDIESDRNVRDESLVTWDPKMLKNILQRNLSGDEVLIVSNREPYLHVRNNDKIEVRVPASGLVTALEPIMRACSGTWIAHGSGSADREVVDGNDRVAVPPENPSYHIRRVWLTPEEEKGYYYGFANEGLWPLCHIAHVRPIFRSADWQAYVDVNRKFAEVVVQEAKTEDPVILIQDYHYALLPKFVREKLPKATIITFWHIPWPNAEAFGICPWREEILEGLLGSDILGFHTRFHCNNFIYTVDRYLEARILRDSSSISHRGELTAIENYPISIEWPSRWVAGQSAHSECRRAIRERYQLAPDHKIGIGVDRLDYTKGLIERFLAVERMFELFPEWIGKFTFIQIAAPSRSVIERYRLFAQEVVSLVERINSKYSSGTYQPIILKLEHHEPPQIYEYFRASDVCIVTSLHDGMNLVAKEFISAREDERGALILSQFTGAAKELPEALLVNPYNIDQCAMAIQVALTMPEIEQRDRMRSMRGLLKEYNVYRWAGRMLMAAARVRKRKRMMGRYHETESLIHGEFLE